MSLIAAEAFGIGLEDIHFSEPPTSVIGDGGSTAATRGTMVGGGAILDAAEKIKRRILSVVGDTLGTCELADTLWSGGLIINRHDESRRIDFKSAVNKTKWASVSLTEYGWFVHRRFTGMRKKAAAVRTLPGCMAARWLKFG